MDSSRDFQSICVISFVISPHLILLIDLERELKKFSPRQIPCFYTKWRQWWIVQTNYKGGLQHPQKNLPLNSAQNLTTNCTKEKHEHCRWLNWMDQVGRLSDFTCCSSSWLFQEEGNSTFQQEQRAPCPCCWWWSCWGSSSSLESQQQSRASRKPWRWGIWPHWAPPRELKIRITNPSHSEHRINH
jgi:hypothetical protein